MKKTEYSLTKMNNNFGANIHNIFLGNGPFPLLMNHNLINCTTTTYFIPKPQYLSFYHTLYEGKRRPDAGPNDYARSTPFVIPIAFGNWFGNLFGKHVSIYVAKNATTGMLEVQYPITESAFMVESGSVFDKLFLSLTGHTWR